MEKETMLEVLPSCKKPGHGKMVLRPIKNQTPEQQFCGVWYDCTYHDCHCSVLYTSKECEDFLNKKATE